MFSHFRINSAGCDQTFLSNGLMPSFEALQKMWSNFSLPFQFSNNQNLIFKSFKHTLFSFQQFWFHSFEWILGFNYPNDSAFFETTDSQRYRFLYDIILFAECSIAKTQFHFFSIFLATDQPFFFDYSFPISSSPFCSFNLLINQLRRYHWLYFEF